MIVKEKISFGNGRTLYNFVASAYDNFPFKRNKTLPEDAVSGSEIYVADLNKTFVYIDIGNGDYRLEQWVTKNSSTDIVGITVYKSNNDVVVINNPVYVSAVITALATAYTVKTIKANGSTTDVSQGSTVGTNYQIVPFSQSVTAGDYAALFIFSKNNPAIGRAKPDKYNCPTVTIGDSLTFGGGGLCACSPTLSISFAFGEKGVGIIPYRITTTETNNREEVEEPTEPVEEEKK